MEAGCLMSFKVGKGHASQIMFLLYIQSNSWMKLWDTTIDYGIDGVHAVHVQNCLYCQEVPMDSCSYILSVNTQLWLTQHVNIQLGLTSPMNLIIFTTEIPDISWSVHFLSNFFLLFFLCVMRLHAFMLTLCPFWCI